MRGSDERTEGLFSYISCEARVPATHPLRAIRAITDEALEVLSLGHCHIFVDRAYEAQVLIWDHATSAADCH